VVSTDHAITEPPVSSQPAAKLIEAAHLLGVPRDYGRQRKLRRMREPGRLEFLGYDTQNRPQWLTPRAARAWQRMRAEAARKNIDLLVVSAFRTIEYQLGILKRKLARGDSIGEILRVAAAPGYSEHHTGRALDVTTPGYEALEEDFAKSPAYRWLCKNAGDFGFRLSYPRRNIHGIAFEPWHWCWHEKRSDR
jgi:zinc D-Ala-D-Ala carboxypeptidase